MPSSANLQIYQGDDFAATVTVTNPDGTAADISTYTAQSQMRRQVADLDATVAAEITTSVTSPYVYLSLTHVQTSQLSGMYVWDLQLTSSTGTVITILAGKAPVTQEVTREPGAMRRRPRYEPEEVAV